MGKLRAMPGGMENDGVPWAWRGMALGEHLPAVRGPVRCRAASKEQGCAGKETGAENLRALQGLKKRPAWKKDGNQGRAPVDCASQQKLFGGKNAREMISVLFAARNSVYKTIPGLDVWDEDRNALKWPGGNPGIFHPPCRLWSRWLRHFSTAPIAEKELALWSVEQVRANGGVLEHPACSLLWDEAQLP